MRALLPECKHSVNTELQPWTFHYTFKDQRPGFLTVMGTRLLVKAAVTIVPFIDDMPCWWWLHHLTPPVEWKLLQNIFRWFKWLFGLLQKRRINAGCFSSPYSWCLGRVMKQHLKTLSQRTWMCRWWGGPSWSLVPTVESAEQQPSL